jgi:hypothetical protein
MEPGEFEAAGDLPYVELKDTKAETLLLSNRDFELFVETILNPPEPGEQLIAACRRFKERVEAERDTRDVKN